MNKGEIHKWPINNLSFCGKRIREIENESHLCPPYILHPLPPLFVESLLPWISKNSILCKQEGHKFHVALMDIIIWPASPYYLEGEKKYKTKKKIFNQAHFHIQLNHCHHHRLIPFIGLCCINKTPKTHIIQEEIHN